MHAGSHANQALLAPALPSLIHHATSVSDAADAAIAILRDNPALCESIPRLTIRAAVRAPLGPSGPSARLLRVLRAIVRQAGAPVRPCQRAVLAELLDLPPGDRSLVLPISSDPTSAAYARRARLMGGSRHPGGLGGSANFAEEFAEAELEIEVQAIELCADLAAGHSFAAEAFARRVRDFPASALRPPPRSDARAHVGAGVSPRLSGRRHRR